MVSRKDIVKAKKIIAMMKKEKDKGGKMSMVKRLKCKVRITKKDWDTTHKDYKAVIKGQRYKVMLTDKGTSLVPVCFKRKTKKKVRR